MAKMTPEQFYNLAIDKLHNEQSKGIHIPISGVQQRAQAYFFGVTPDSTKEKKAEGKIKVRQLIDNLVKEGKFSLRPAKFGVMLFKASDAPPMTESQKKAAAFDELLNNDDALGEALGKSEIAVRAENELNEGLEENAS